MEEEEQEKEEEDNEVMMIIMMIMMMMEKEVVQEGAWGRVWGGGGTVVLAETELTVPASYLHISNPPAVSSETFHCPFHSLGVHPRLGSSSQPHDVT
eukprot:764898-Hanusia_phi.AAC.20